MNRLKSTSKMKKLSDMLNGDSDSDIENTPTTLAMKAFDNDTVELSNASDAHLKSGRKRKRRIIDSDSDSDSDAKLSAATVAGARVTSIATNQVPYVSNMISTPPLAPSESHRVTQEPIPPSTTAIDITKQNCTEIAKSIPHLPLTKQPRERSTMCLGDLLDRNAYKISPLKAASSYGTDDSCVVPLPKHAASSSSFHVTSTALASTGAASDSVPGEPNGITGSDGMEVGHKVSEVKLSSTRMEPEFDDWMEETTIPLSGKSTEVTASTVKKKAVRRRSTAKRKNEEEIDDTGNEVALHLHAPVPIPHTLSALPFIAPVAAIITMLVPPLPNIEIRMPDDLTSGPLPGTPVPEKAVIETSSKKRTLPKSLGRISSQELHGSALGATAPIVAKDSVAEVPRIRSLSTLQETLSRSAASGFLDPDRNGSDEAALGLYGTSMNGSGPNPDVGSSKGNAGKLRRLKPTNPYVDPLSQSRLDPNYLHSQIPPDLRGKLSVTDIYLQLLKNESKKRATPSALVAMDELRNTDSDSPADIQHIDDSDDSM